MRPFLFFLAFVGTIVGTIAWIMGSSRAIDGLKIPDNFDDEGL